MSKDSSARTYQDFSEKGKHIANDIKVSQKTKNKD